MEINKEYLSLYSRDCKTCGHLDPEEVADPDIKCLYSNGNRWCPAAEIQIVIVGEAQRMAQRVLRARSKRDAELEARIMNRLKNKSPAFKERFYFYVESKT